MVIEWLYTHKKTITVYSQEDKSIRRVNRIIPLKTCYIIATYFTLDLSLNAFLHQT